MLFFYIRHGDPIYEPDSLTPLGEKQAEALSKRLASFGLDKIYCSTSNRALLTAKPTCEKLGVSPVLCDWAHETIAWNNFTYLDDGHKGWMFEHPSRMKLFAREDVLALGEKWYEHELFKDYNYKAELERIKKASDELFLSLGYEHIGRGRYKVVRHNDERVGFFAHQGFGLIFLSLLLNIPYSEFCMRFDLSHSSVTVIEFEEVDGLCIPRICSLSNDSHLYKEGLPTLYNERFKF